MPNTTREQFAEQTQNFLNDYIILADKKASILLTAQLAFIGLYGNILTSNWEGSHVCFKVASLFTVFLNLCSIVFAGGTIYPRSKDPEDSLMLWDSIASKPINNYKNEVKTLGQNEVFDELLNENHKLASVAVVKYKYFRVSIFLTAVTLALGLISIGLLLFI